MPLTDEEHMEVEAILRKELAEHEHKAGMNWGMLLLVGSVTIAVALVCFVVIVGSPASSPEWGNLAMVTLGIGVLAILAIHAVTG